jgi:hypothetical protein
VGKARSFAARTIVAGSLPLFLSQLIRLVNRLSGRLALMTTGEYLRKNFKDPLLRALLASQWMDYGLPPFQSAFAIHALIVNHYFDGAWYPQGGSGVIAGGAQTIIENSGGKVLLNHEVIRIVVEGGRAVGVDVRLVNKTDSPVRRFNAPVIISDVGAWNTVERLLSNETNISFRKEMNALVSAEHPGSTMVTLYLGLDRDPSCVVKAGHTDQRLVPDRCRRRQPGNRRRINGRCFGRRAYRWTFRTLLHHRTSHARKDEGIGAPQLSRLLNPLHVHGIPVCNGAFKQTDIRQQRGTCRTQAKHAIFDQRAAFAD